MTCEDCVGDAIQPRCHWVVNDKQEAKCLKHYMDLEEPMLTFIGPGGHCYELEELLEGLIPKPEPASTPQSSWAYILGK